MTCMFRLPCALLDLLAVSVVRLHDLTKSQKKTTYCKSSKGGIAGAACLGGWWGGLAGSCVSRFFVQNLPQCRFTGSWTWLINCRYTFFGVMESVAGDETQTDTHTRAAHTHTHVHIQTFMSEAAVRGQRFCSPEILKMKNTGQRERQTETLTIWLEAFLDQQRLCLLPRRTTSNPTRSSWFPLTYFFEGSSAFVCMPFGAWYTCALRVCGSKLCNEKGKLYFHRPKFISNNLRYAGRKMTWACNTCVYMSLTCADTAALLLVPETLTCELCVLKITG